LAAKSGGGFVV